MLDEWLRSPFVDTYGPTPRRPGVTPPICERNAMTKQRGSMSVRRVGFLLVAAGILATVLGVRGPEAAATRCSYSSSNPAGSVHRVHAIPRGCLWLARTNTPMPSLRVRQRDLQSRWHDRTFSFPVPEGFLGVCAENTGVFVVSYPFVTFAAGELEGSGTCSANLHGMAMWLARLSPAPRITALWRTSR